MADGRLDEGDALPSTRALAAQLGCSRTTAVQAYDELTAAGYVTARPGSASYVATGAPAAAAERLATRVTATARPSSRPAADTSDRLISLAAGRPDVSLIDPRDWRRAWRHAATRAIDADTPWIRPNADLEAALVDHLRRRRAIVAETVHLSSGTSSALTALAAVTGLPCVVEDPCYQRAREALMLAGHDASPCPVDDDGLIVDRLPQQASLVYVTPAHQFPTGARMSLPRRREIVAWANDTGSRLVEDDYDGEFRYGFAPLPALASLPHARDVVAYVGTASKMLTPNLQTAWIVTPPRLTEPLAEELRLRRNGIPQTTAAALAHFIATGALDRHIARAGRTYAARRAALVQALRRELPGVSIGGIEAGIHLRVDIPCDTAVTQQLVSHGYATEALSDYCQTVRRSGLIIGYAQLPETRAPDLARAISASLSSHDEPTTVPGQYS